VRSLMSQKTACESFRSCMQPCVMCGRLRKIPARRLGAAGSAERCVVTSASLGRTERSPSLRLVTKHSVLIDTAGFPQPALVSPCQLQGSSKEML
jgi:hypothetical protein